VEQVVFECNAEIYKEFGMLVNIIFYLQFLKIYILRNRK